MEQIRPFGSCPSLPSHRLSLALCHALIGVRNGLANKTEQGPVLMGSLFRGKRDNKDADRCT